MEQDLGTEVLSLVKLKQFQARRKWARCVEAIRAMNKLSDIMTRRKSLRSLSCHNRNSIAVAEMTNTGVSMRRATSLTSRPRPASSHGVPLRSQSIYINSKYF